MLDLLLVKGIIDIGVFYLLKYVYKLHILKGVIAYLFLQIDKFVSTSKLKYYFAVDTSYVGRKLALLMFPFSHQVATIEIYYYGNFR